MNSRAGSAASSGISPVLQAYLDDFDLAAQRLPRKVRHDLRARLWVHCAEHAGANAGDDRLREALAALGSPEEIVGAELAHYRVRPDPFSRGDLAAVHLLGASFLTLGIGALVGLALLWRSRIWPTRHKLVASTLLPLGFVTLLPVMGAGAALLFGAALIGPVLAAVYLLVARVSMRRGRRTSSSA